MCKTNRIYFLVLFVLLNSCATFKMQVSDENTFEKPSSKLAHTFYLIGDAGNSKLGEKDIALQYLEEEIKKSPKDATLLFLGDNVYEKGIPKKKKKKKYKLAKHRLKVQTDIGEKFIGRSIMIPGNHDWYSGLDGLKRQEKLVEKALGKNAYLPQNGCPIEKVAINDQINLILIDSHWFVTDWNKHPGINDDCEIKTREQFLEEYESMIKKSRGKTTIVAVHHPLFTNGSHGGNYSFKSHFKPFPILGTIKNVLRKTTGVANVDIQHKMYNEFRKRIITISQSNEKVIFVSGHEHSLQYINRDNVHQIVSGSGSKKSAVKNGKGAHFGYGTQGFARLDVYENGASTLHFYSAKDQKIVYERNVLPADSIPNYTNFKNVDLPFKKARIYDKNEVQKSKFFEFLWGKRYRQYFGTEIIAPTVNLDTLYGGLQPMRRGGGHQSKSLRLKDNKGRQYVMRALRKNAVQYLQAVVFKDQYIEGQFEKTYTESLLMDVFTGSHPYAPFTIEELAKAGGIYHTRPRLFYVPKQPVLGEYNENYGNELYMIEERTDSNHGDKENFGFSDELISTDDMRKQIAKDEKYVVDEKAYIRARLFDMLVGDWDRHQDQWRWAEFKKKKKIEYRPVPRDRDQAFSRFSDGVLLNYLTKAIPDLRGMRSYDEDLKKPKWFSYSAYPLDMLLISDVKKKNWDKEVAFLQEHITDDIIDKAFLRMPKEVQDETVEDIKRKLKGRRDNLQKIADRYYEYFYKFQVLKGTNKDDWFEIERKDEKTKITIYRIKNGDKGKKILEKNFSNSITKEIWLYGLDDEDTFEVVGNPGKKPIKIIIIGGLNNDYYDISNGKRITVYDQKSKKNTFSTTTKVKTKFTDEYDLNTFDYTKLKGSTSMVLPDAGYNPDDGVKLGLQFKSVSQGFERNPFTSKHSIEGNYFFATQGYELNYEGEFANVIGNWNLGIDAVFNSPNFARNFFGFGNNSQNPEAFTEDEDRDFNRVRIGKTILGSSIKWRGKLGALIQLSAKYQNFNVERTPGRFLETQFNENNRVFSSQHFFNTSLGYHFKHEDNKGFPTLGFEFSSEFGYTSNLKEKRDFSYNITTIGFTHKLISSGKIVFATKAMGHFLFNDEFEFYQAANIGANNGLRSFRNERFNGKNGFYHSSDLRFNLSQFRTQIVPLTFGIYTGFDYGMVWGSPESLVTIPNGRTYLNTSAGGGFFISAANQVAGRFGMFYGEDGARISINLGFNL